MESNTSMEHTINSRINDARLSCEAVEIGLVYLDHIALTTCSHAELQAAIEIAQGLIVQCGKQSLHLEERLSCNHHADLGSRQHRALSDALHHHVRRLHILHRNLQYRLVDRALWDLPNDARFQMGQDECIRASRYVAYRAAWLTQRLDASDAATYPDTPRYYELASEITLSGPDVILSMQFEDQVATNARFVFDIAANQSFEWSVFLNTLGALTEAEVFCETLLNWKLRSLCQNRKLMQPVPAHVAIASENTQCPICDADYSDTPGDSLILERPVKTRCNHYFGEGCLTEWVQADQDSSHTCPMCRADILAASYEWPSPELASAATLYRSSFGDRDLDRKIDAFLRGMTVKDQTNLHDKEFGVLLAMMHERVLILENRAAVLHELWSDAYFSGF